MRAAAPSVSHEGISRWFVACAVDSVTAEGCGLDCTNASVGKAFRSD